MKKNYNLEGEYFDFKNCCLNLLQHNFIDIIQVKQYRIVKPDEGNVEKNSGNVEIDLFGLFCFDNAEASEDFCT